MTGTSRPRSVVAWFALAIAMTMASAAGALWAAERAFGARRSSHPRSSSYPGFGLVGAIITSRSRNVIGPLFLALAVVGAGTALTFEYAVRALGTDPGSLPFGGYARGLVERRLPVHVLRARPDVAGVPRRAPTVAPLAAAGLDVHDRVGARDDPEPVRADARSRGLPDPEPRGHRRPDDLLARLRPGPGRSPPRGTSSRSCCSFRSRRRRSSGGGTHSRRCGSSSAGSRSCSRRSWRSSSSGPRSPIMHADLAAAVAGTGVLVLVALGIPASIGVAVDEVPALRTRRRRQQDGGLRRRWLLFITVVYVGDRRRDRLAVRLR